MNIVKGVLLAIISVLVGILVIIGIYAIYLFIQWYPVIDRINNPCKYYPNAFADCRKENL